MKKILTLIIVGVIIYMILQKSIQSIIINHNLNTNNAKLNSHYDTNSNNDTHNIAKSSLESQKNNNSQNIISETISNILVTLLKTNEGKIVAQKILRPMNAPISNPDDTIELNSQQYLNSIFKIVTFGNSNTEEASCGHTVNVNYTISNNKNIVLDEKTTNIQLGSNKIAPGVDAVIVGMKVGQTRHATISNQYIAATKNDQPNEFKITILLNEISPKIPLYSQVKIFDDKITYKIPLLCGSNVTFDAKITQLSNNKILYDSLATKQKLKMQIGDPQAPMIFSHALHNKIPIGTRSVIAQGQSFKTYHAKHSTILSNTILPEQEYFLLELFNFNK